MPNTKKEQEATDTYQRPKKYLGFVLFPNLDKSLFLELLIHHKLLISEEFTCTFVQVTTNVCTITTVFFILRTLRNLSNILQ